MKTWKRFVCVFLLAGLWTGNVSPTHGASAAAAELLVFYQAANSKTNPQPYVMVKGSEVSFTSNGKKWKLKSSNKTVVAIKNGCRAIAKKSGKSLITASYGNNTYYYEITVEDPKLNARELTLELGKTKTLKLSGTSGKISWSIENKKIASINSRGKVTAKKTGTTYAYARVHNWSYQCRITCVEPSLSRAIKTGDTKYLSGASKKVVEKASDVIKNYIRQDMDTTEKIRAIHDYIVLHTAYDYDNYLNDTIPKSSFHPSGVLLHQTGVCQGYAETFQLFMEALDIPCRIISGKAGGESHAWNLAKVSGSWYHLDATWDDPVPDTPGKIRYDYFLVSDKVMKKNHSWLSKDYPACDSEDFIYYIWKDYIIPSITGFQEKFMEQYEKGSRDIIVLYPEKAYPDWNFIWNYCEHWSYYDLKQVGDYYMLEIVIQD